MKRKMIAVLMTAALAVTGLAGCQKTTAPASGTEKGQAGEATKITICVPDPEASYIYQAAQEFAKRAEEYSGGTLQFTISGNGSLYGGDTAAGIKQLSAGSLDMVILASSVYASFNPGFNVISVPYMFDDQQQLLDYLNSDTGKGLMNSVSDMGITTVGSWTRSFRKVTNSKRPVNSPEDVKGLVLRVPNNSLYVEFFKACGATCTPMNFSEVYNALQLKTLDGQENPIDVPYSNKFFEVQKYISQTDHMADAWLAGFNSEKFNKLTDDQKNAIMKAGEEVQSWNVEFMAKEDGTALQTLLDNGMEYNEVSAENRQKFIDISKSCYPVFKELIKDDALFEATSKFCNKQ